MMNQSTVESSNLPFDVVAVPQTNISQILDSTIHTMTKPVNIKVRVRNKEETTGRIEVISIPKITKTCQKKVRLVGSDQTIISFDLFMETEDEKKASNKPRHKFFKLFKSSGCFNNQNDDDIYPYVPSSSNETYRTKSASNVNYLQDDKILEEKLALKKNHPPIVSTNITPRIPTFMDKYKPGGCLDPSFDEDKYIYKPKNKMLAIDQKNIGKQGFVEKCVEDIKKLDKILDKPDTTQDSPSKSSIVETYSHPLITYPPAVSSRSVLEENQNKKSKLRTFTEKKVKISVNEFSDTYFMPPKKQKSINNKKLSTEFFVSEKTPKEHDSSDRTVTGSFITQKESQSQPTIELFNQSTTSEEKKISTHINESDRKFSENDLLKDRDNNVSVSIADIKIQILKHKSSSSDVFVTELNLSENKINSLSNPQIGIITFEGTENYDAESKTDKNVTGSNPNSLSGITSLTHDVLITAKGSRISKKESNYTMDELKFMPNNLLNAKLNKEYDASQLSMKEEIQVIKITDMHQNVDSTAIITNQEHSDTNDIDNDIVKENLDETEDKNNDQNLTALISEAADEQIAAHKLIEITREDAITDINISKHNESENKFSILAADLKDLKTGINIISGNVDTNNETPPHVLQEKISSTLQTQEKDSDDFIINHENKEFSSVISQNVKLTSSVSLNSTKSKESEKKSSVLVADLKDLKTGINILSGNLDTNNKTPAPVLQEKISSTFQTQEKDNNDFINHENKQFSTVSSQSVQLTSSVSINSSKPNESEKNSSVLVAGLKDLKTGVNIISNNFDTNNVTPPPALQEKISSTFKTQEKDYNDFINHENKEFSTVTSQSVKLTSSVSINSTKSNESVKKSSALAVGLKDLKTGVNIILNNFDTNNVTPPPASQEKMSSTFKTQEKDNNDFISHENKQFRTVTSQSVKLISSVSINSTKSNESEKVSSILAVDSKDLKTGVNITSDNVDTNNVTLPPALQEKMSLTFKIQEKNNNDFIIHENKQFSSVTSQSLKLTSSLNLSSSLALPEKTSSISESYEKYTINNDPVNYRNKDRSVSSQILKLPSFDPDDVVQENLENNDIDEHHDLSTKDYFFGKEESTDKESLETKPELQITKSKITSIVSDNRKSSINEKVEYQTKILKDYSNFYQSPSDLHISKVYSTNLKETPINDDEINSMKAEGKKMRLNKNSSIEINLGFHTFINNKNETVIRTFDTSKYLKTDTQDKITIIKSIIRKNDNEIRVPVNSEMDLTIQVKKTFYKGNIAKRVVDNIKKELTQEASRSTLKRDVLLQETLDSVYENLVPVENIIRNLKQEADFLTHQQYSFREILNTMKATSKRIININKKCTCNKYSIM